MMRRLLIGAAMVLAFLAPGTAAAASPVKLARLDARFPERSFLVSLPQSLRLTANDVRVTENGRPVDDPTLVPATLARGTRRGVVLVIDASDSMHGGPIAAALAAARTFDSHRLPGELLAVIEFNRTSSVVLPFTEDEQQIQAALSRAPAIARGTHIYDAVSDAVQLLAQAHINGGSVVLLSDGADTGSAAGAAAVAAAAGSSHVRVFTVGLRSHAFQAGPLRSLAAATGGRFSEAASAADLQPIYDQLGAELANQYVLRYRSLARAGSAVTVRVKVRGIPGSAESAYVAPALPPPPSTIYHLSVLQRYWRSDVALVVTVLAAGLLFGAGTMLLVRPRGKSLSQRMAEFVSIRSNQRSEASFCPTACSRASSARCEAPASGLASRRSWRSPASRCQRSRSCSGPASGPSPPGSFWPRSPARRFWGSRRWSSPSPCEPGSRPGFAARGGTSQSSCRTTCR
jgi:tight adherence protein B